MSTNWKKEAQKLATMLEESREHHRFCNWGDSYERQCADTQRLPERIEDALIDFYGFNP